MKTKIYIVTFTSYTESDNYLHNDAQTFTNEQEAISEYDRTCDSQRDECRWGAGVDNEDHTDDYEYDVTESHDSKETADGYRLTFEAESDAYEGYKVQVRLEAKEIELPRAIETAHKVGDEIVWEKYGEDHKGRVTDIDLFISTDNGGHYQHAVYRTTESETGERWYVNEEDIIE